jgi:hypothetical protein
MELVKREDHWALYNEDGHKIAATTPGCNSKLSLKNCQEIESGYDLDELTDEHYDIHIKRGHTEEDSLQRKIDFILGFQKALEVNNTKLYTLEDMMNCWNKALTFQNHKETLGEYIQSLQQTEWDVEIEMEDIFVKNNEQYVDEVGIGNYSTHSKKPKLDAEGNLILRRTFPDSSN